jgi:CRISPR-associated protein Cas7/Csh2 subtype I-B
MNNSVAKSRQILFLYDCRDGNPNGERDSVLSGPRIDPYNKKAMVSDLCLKRIVRDYFQDKYPKDTDKRILVQNELRYSESESVELKDIFLNDLGKNEDEIASLNFDQKKSLLSSRFIDHRLFGSLLRVDKALYSTTGATQFEIAHSLNIPYIISPTITSTIASEAGKGAGALGKTHILNYALIAFNGIIKNSLAKLSGMNEGDVLLLFEALWNGILAKTTRTKPQLLPRLLISIISKEPNFQLPLLTKYIENENINAKNFLEISLNMEKFVNLISQFIDQIECIEYRMDPEIQLIYKGKNYNSFAEIVQKSPKQPAIKQI